MTSIAAARRRREELEAALRAHGPGLALARVISQHSGVWAVAEPRWDGDGAGDGPLGPPRLVHARGRLRDAAEGPPVTGDWVALDRDDAIVAVLPRRGTVARRAAGEGRAGRQVLAANVELALVAEPLPEPNARRVQRLVAIAGAGGVPVALLLTKADLAADADATARRLGDAVGVAAALAVTVRGGDGVDAVRALLAPGTTGVILGPSGAGKSTLVNALLGEERQATGAVRAADGRGRHTTVTRELLALPNGALLIDTPGIREVGMWDEAVEDAFEDIARLAAGCRFSDCAHDREPGCAVRDAVDPARLAAWRRLREERAWAAQRRAGRPGAEASAVARRGRGRR